MRLMAILAAAVGASHLFALPAQAATYGFVAGQEVGSFTTGAASPLEAGYFLLTNFDFTTLYTGGQTLSDVDITSFDTDTAFDPVTNQFINGGAGHEFPDTGGFTKSIFGEEPVVVQPFQVGDFLTVVQGRSFAILQGPFTVTSGLPSSVPEPGTWALMIAGIGSIGLMLRRQGKNLGITATGAKTPE